MTADEGPQLQPPAPQQLRLTDLRLEQLHHSDTAAADALQGYMYMNKHWELRETLTSLRFTFRPRYLDDLGLGIPGQEVSCAAACCCCCPVCAAVLVSLVCSHHCDRLSVHFPAEEQFDQIALAALLGIAASVIVWQWQADVLAVCQALS